MSDVLTRIVADKADEVARRKAARSEAEIVRAAASAEPTRGFAAALAAKAAAGEYGLIAEIKKASPSRGLIRADFDPSALARAYEAGGAACLSVLTDAPYFQGDDAYLGAARAATELPALRKDFMIDPYQVAESRAIGADCILLIMACLDDARAAELSAAAREFGLDVLIETHDAAEVERALRLPSGLIGVNNRNLKTLKVDIETTFELRELVPRDRLLVAESGLRTPDDLARLASRGVFCFLVGEHLMNQPDVEAATRTLLARPG